MSDTSATSGNAPREAGSDPTLGGMEMTGVDKTCSFCGVTWNPELRFLGGFGAFICKDCAERAATKLGSEEYAAFVREPRAPWDSMSEDELLARLPEILANSEQVDRFLHQWVDLLRERGVSWQRIGLALGVTRQAAWERFTRAKRATPKSSKQA